MSAYYHDIHPPTPGSKTGRVWQIADRLSREKGRKAKREEVISAYVAEGGNANTASTQFSRWNKFREGEDPGSASKPAHSRSDGPVQLVVGSDGRVVIPAALRRQMALDPDAVVTALIDEDGVLTIVSRRAAIRRAQRLARLFDRGRGSVADELIAERRAEAQREENDA